MTIGGDARPQRRSVRLRSYDYAGTGPYFVTVCTWNGQHVFGEVVDGRVALSAWGEVVTQCWKLVPNHFPAVRLDEFVVMPNHVHGLVFLGEGSEAHRPVAEHSQAAQRRFGSTQAASLAVVVGSFKAAATRAIRQVPGSARAIVWQRNYYEHVVRDEEGLSRIREYIHTNPLRWHLDSENPHHAAQDDFDLWLASFHSVSRGHHCR